VYSTIKGLPGKPFPVAPDALSDGLISKTRDATSIISRKRVRRFGLFRLLPVIVPQQMESLNILNSGAQYFRRMT